MTPFKNITVLDMSQGIAGPVCGAIFARQGARVIKVEPLTGDWMRATGGSREGMSANVIAGNINKEGIALDVTKPKGRDVILRLAKTADVLVENFRPGIMKKLGFDYATIKAINPGIVFGSINGFGPEGPLVGKPATDSVVQAYSGMAVANGSVGAEGILPRRIGIYVPDNISAIYAAQAISAALFERASTGQGQHVQISLAQCCAAIQSGPIIDELLFSQGGKRTPILAPTGDFRTADGWMVVTVLNDDMFARLCKALNQEQWLADPRFAINDVRKMHSQEINGLLAEVMKRETTAVLLGKLEAADVLVSAINTYQQLIDSPQAKAMQYFGSVEQSPFGAITVPHLPGADQHLRPAPKLGEHSRDILANAGYDQAEIAELMRLEVVKG